ncbi:hypothetical protein [Agriterribacter humi]|uniref:hypothetical protein n=1 Tax=Agriterribacter humi TaxID=1104781 RepID=UPI001263ED96|nr:hypothetical protein [Agriterribacter humi]
MQTVAQQTKMNAFVSSLMSKMTIAEKIGQLNLLKKERYAFSVIAAVYRIRKSGVPATGKAKTHEHHFHSGR